MNDVAAAEMEAIRRWFGLKRIGFLVLGEKMMMDRVKRCVV